MISIQTYRRKECYKKKKKMSPILRMLAKIRRRYYRRKKLIIKITLSLFLICFYKWYTADVRLNLNIARRYVNQNLQDEMKYDKGTGCELPDLDPFSEVVTRLERKANPVTCRGKDWVKCYHSECRVLKEILDTTRSIMCIYRDIIYVNDNKYILGTPVYVHGDKPYFLITSDHVKIKCIGTPLHRIIRITWLGVGAGFRGTLLPERRPSTGDFPNVLLFGYDSLSKNGFIRRMPKTYKYITEELKMTILHGYNIVGDGSPAALFPILSGVTELEIPDARRNGPKSKVTIESNKFIFHKVKQNGYRTAYFEDMPMIGTFQLRFNGFDVQPADHYLRGFFQEEWKKKNLYCVGATLTHRLIMNLTEQFLSFSNSKRFIFNFIMGVAHEDFNVIAQVDVATVEFFKSFKEKGFAKNTLLIFMGNHGARYNTIRKTLQGRLEERLPLMAILLPEDLQRTRPSAQKALELNTRVLTTPFDIHATLLDALGLTQYMSDYKIPGADFPRAMSLLKPISKNRSCSEAGVEPHWCTCTSWKYVVLLDPMFKKTANALLDFINRLTEPVRSFCVPRTLTSIEWVMRQSYTKGVMEFKKTMDVDGYVASFGAYARPEKVNYQVKLILGPGTSVFESKLTYITMEREFAIDSRDISRTSKYHHEPDCIELTYPHLKKYCYCKNHVVNTSSRVALGGVCLLIELLIFKLCKGLAR